LEIIRGRFPGHRPLTTWLHHSVRWLPNPLGIATPNGNRAKLNRERVHRSVDRTLRNDPNHGVS